ncbi:heavy metal translocating P-type ATPase [Spirosoma foliorum]|uniref:Heavy metal translocating P-type ATPase metal-binding domain-containing protein n=1 Tax=Spirosoma foliorum TaxID=2710596 RepID=A0A7G5GPW1_9BACT|nr:heavy metal translocating P-type ATPase metal-binding domain-containing protein [Spirosoma foliorum]QMW00903.1 heavy metal translocating P-type ATPase metal-binding domain-containing protein [Spirosoma foliorum]
MSTATISSTICYHCGNDCPDESIVLDDKLFCCDGCKTVYSILNQHQLCQYYDIEQLTGSDQSRPGQSRPGQSRPGNSLKTDGARQTRLEFLDHPDIVAQLLEFSSESVAKVTFYIPTIHCSSCLWLLEHLYRINPSIQQARVDFLKKQVHLTYNPTELTLRQVVELLSSIGYEPLISLNDVVQAGQKISNRPFLYRLGIAGFCAGNIMLFSFPEYLGLDDSSFKHLFGILNLLLAIPVVFYSASGYFESVWASLKKGVINIDLPILLGILVAFFRGTYEVLFLDGAGYFDSLTGLIFFLLCGKWFQQRTHEFLSFERDYKSYFPMAVTVVGRGATGMGQEGKENEQGVGVNNPLPTAPYSIPLAQLRKGDRIRVRNNELIPADGLLYKGQGMIDYSFVTGESEPESKEPGALVYAGGKQVGEAIELEVVRDVSQSYLTQLWNNDAFQKKDTSRIRTFADAVGTYFTITVISLATLVGLYWYAWHDPARAINAFTAVLIIACPCALSLSYPFALGNGLRLLGKRHLYLKNADVIEQMSACDTIVFDKTGTLTTPQQAVVERFDKSLSSLERGVVVSLVRQSVHPLSRKLTTHLSNALPLPVDGFTEVPGHGIQAIVDGLIVKIGSRSFVDPSFGEGTERRETLTEARTYLSIDHQYRGYFGFPNQYRLGLEPMLASLHKTHRLYLLSGDNDHAQAELTRLFPDAGQMYFNFRPEEKLAFIKHLQDNGRRVMMVGDGLNDAGALKQADVGIAVTDDTIQFTPASDAILEAGALMQLPAMLNYTRFGMRLIRFSFVVSLVYNFIGLSYALTGHLSPVVAAILMPISSATMLAISTLGMRWKKF